MPFVFAILFSFAALPAFSSEVKARADFRQELEQKFYEDKTRNLTIEDLVAQADRLEWRPIEAVRSRFGYSSSRIWVRFHIPESRLKLSKSDPVMLEIANVYLERLVLYRVRGGEIVRIGQSGMGVSINERGPSFLPTGYTAVRLSPPRFEDSEYFVSLEGPFPLSLPLSLWEAPDYAYHHWTSVLFVGVFIGILALAALLNGIMAASLRSSVYWNYSFFVVSILMLYLGHEGLTIQLLWPDSPWWAMREMHVYGALTLFFYVLFVRAFLSIPRDFPKFDLALKILVGVSSFRALWMLANPYYQPIAMIGELAILLSNILVLVIAFRSLILGTRSSRFFFLSSLVFNISIILFLLQEANLIWIGDFMARAPQVGTVLEVLLLGLALADRIKQVNNELGVQKAAILHAEKLSALGRMAGEIAHEINNPLAIIHGNAAVLGKLELSSEAREIAGTIEQTALRISKLVKGMRALARDSSLDPLRTTSFSSILQDSLSLCQERPQRAGVKFSSPECDPDLALRCRGSEISQVLLNLLNNAIDATEGQKDSWVRVETKVRAEILEISVCDNGTGVPREIRARIHEPFFTTKEPGKGLGLGLSISQTIVEGHGGKLWLEESSVGTRFTFSIPLAQGVAAARGKG